MNNYTAEIINEERKDDPDEYYIAWLKKKRKQGY